MNHLSLKLLGTVEVWYEGQLLTFPTRKALALLIYLAVTGQRHSREHLITLFWPESDTARGQASLRNALLRLRRSLGTANHHLQADDLFITLEGQVTVDVQHLAEAATVTDVAVWQTAVLAYKGDFLVGFTLPNTPEFDNWVAAQRQQSHRHMSDILAQLSHAQTEAGQARAAIETAVHWTQHDPLNEAAHRRLMELHLLAGDKTAALQTYEAYHQRLKAELGLEPSPEFQALVEKVRVGKQKSRDVEGRPSPLRTRPLVSPLPFVGRSIKHLQLVTAYYAARQGQTQVVVLEGEAGIGKTRLAAEFLQWTAVHGGDILQGKAFETGGRLPYQPLADALRPRLERENAPEDLLSDIWLAELSRLLPELRDRYPDLPLPLGDEATARTRLMAAITQLGMALVECQQPLILFMDDLQWVDTATLDILRHSCSVWSQNQLPVLLLLAWRGDESSLADWLTSLNREGVVQRLVIEPLTAVDIQQFLQQLGVTHSTFASWLHTQTAGHPFYLVETFKELLTRGVLQWQGDHLDSSEIDDWLTQQAAAPLLPDNVRHLIQSRLHRLTHGAAALLMAAAVLGRDSSYRRLCQVANLGEEVALPGLDELLHGRFLQETTHPMRPYAITHDKIREVVYATATIAQRQLFHQRAYEALTASNTPAAELAYHALAAHLSEPAFNHSLEAGDEALHLFAVQDAIGYYQQAKSLALSFSLSPPPALFMGLGRAYELAGDLSRATAVYQEWHQLTEQQNQPELICQALNRLATVAVHEYHFETAVAHLQQAQTIASDIGSKQLLAETKWTLAQLYHHQFDFQQSLNYSQQTLNLARELDNLMLTADSLNALAYAHLFLGQVENGRGLMTEARTAYNVLGNKALEADCLTAIAAAHFWLGQVDEACQSAQTALTICTEIANPWGSIYSRVWLAAALLDKGDYEAALAETLAGQAEAQQHNLPAMSIFITIILGQVQRTLGQLDQAIATHKTALTMAEAMQSTMHIAYVASELCADYVLADAWTEAADFALLAQQHRRYDILPLVLPCLEAETAVLLQTNHHQQAHNNLQQSQNLWGNLPRFRIPYLRSQAMIAEARGDTAQTISCL